MQTGGGVEAALTRSIVVVDMVGSTQLFSDLGSRQADLLRRAVFAMLAEETSACGGDLIKTTGDGCLSTFDGASRAIEAALAMHRGAARLSRRFVWLQLRAGIAAGDISLDGGDVYGTPVVLAARLCDAARPEQVLVSQLVADLAGDRGSHRYRSLDPLDLKGISGPVAVCEALGADVELVPPLHASLQRLPDEVLVGREDDLAVLRLAWKDALAAEGGLALIQGDPGIGKSRLAAAFAREVYDDGGLVLLGRCEPNRNIPYEPFRGPLSTLVATTERSVLRSHVDRCGGELGRLVPGLVDRLSGVPDVEPSDPDIERDRLFDAVTDLLERCAAESPLLLVLEDLHWATHSTLQMLDHLVDRAQVHPMLLLATFRDAAADRSPELDGVLARRGSADVARLALRGLSADQLQELVSELADEELDDEGQAFVRSLHDRTDGNPFFAAQVLRHLVERGDLARRGDRWRAGPAELDLPRGVVEVVGHRVGRLSEAAQEVLPLAAVLGQRFTLEDLRLASDLEVRQLVASLDEALAARLLADLGQGAFSFNHAIVRETLLAGLSSSRLALLHLQVAEALAEAGPSDGQDDARILAEHFIAAGVLGEAGPAARHAIDAAIASLWQTDHEGARDVLERAAAVVAAGRIVDHAALHDVLLTLVWVLISRLDPRFREVVPEAAAAARRTGSPERLAAVALCVTGMSQAGEPDAETVDLLREALGGLVEPDTAIRAYVLAALGFAELLGGDPVGAAHIDEALEITERIQGTDENVLAQVKVLSAFASVGRPGAVRRLELVESAIRSSPESADWRSGLRIQVPLMMTAVLGPEVRGLARLASGDRAAFEQSYGELRDIAERSGTSLALGWSLQWRAMLALLDGRFEEAPTLGYAAVEAIPTEANYALGYQGQLLWQALEQGTAGATVELLRAVVEANPRIPAFRASFAMAHLLAGDHDSARSEVDATLISFPTYARDWLWPQTPYLLAEVAATLGMARAAGPLQDELDPYAGELLVVGPGVYVIGAYDRARGMVRSLAGAHDEAVSCLRAAIDAEERISAPPLVARSRLWLARALLARGSSGDGAEALDQAQRSHEVATSLGMVALAADAAGLIEAGQAR